MNKNLKKIIIKTKKQVFSETSGNNSSIFKGEGYDFLELKEYEYGDDVKNIDWTISAKMKKPYSKVFHAQREIDINIVSFLDGKTYFGTKQFKKDLMVEIASILAYSSIKQGDPFSSFIANNTFELATKKSKKLSSAIKMSELLYEYNPIGKNINYKIVVDKLFKTIKKKSIVFLIGDFIDIKELDLRILAKKHEVFAIIVRDHFEEKPENLGNVNLIDSSSGLQFDGVIDNSLVKEYEKYIENNDHILYEHFQKCAIRFKKVYTNEEPISKIMTLLSGVSK